MLASNLMSDANVATLATKTFFKFGGRPYFPQAQAPPPVNPQYNPYNPNPYAYQNTPQIPQFK